MTINKQNNFCGSIINTYQFLLPGRIAAGLPPYYPNLSTAYFDTKERIVALEQDILRALAFDVEVTHPYKYVALFAEALCCTTDVVTLAMAVVNDSYSDPDICLNHSPLIVGVCAIYVAVKIRSKPPAPIQKDYRMEKAMKLEWWKVLGTSTEQLNHVGAKLAIACNALNKQTNSKSSS